MFLGFDLIAVTLSNKEGKSNVGGQKLMGIN